MGRLNFLTKYSAPHEHYDPAKEVSNNKSLLDLYDYAEIADSEGLHHVIQHPDGRLCASAIKNNPNYTQHHYFTAPEQVKRAILKAR